jgi:hypothetical protein
MSDVRELDDLSVPTQRSRGEPRQHGSSRVAWIRLIIARFAPAVGAYSACKLVGTVSFLLLVRHSRVYSVMPWYSGIHDKLDVLAAWDATWYIEIAKHGYHTSLVPLQPWLVAGSGGQTLKHTDTAFFPLFPMLMRFVHEATGVGFPEAGLAVAVVASLAAAAGIYLLGELVIDRRAGVLAAALWAVAPASGVEWAVYSESLFIALAAWCLYAILRRRWLSAGMLALWAGVCRPTAVELFGALFAAALADAVRRRPGAGRALAAALLAPTGFAGYLLWVGLRAGRLDGYEVGERYGWVHYFDFGRFMAHAAVRVAEGQVIWSDYPLADQFALLMIVALPCVVLMFLRDRPPRALTVYVVLVLVVALTSHQIFANVPRYVLPAFPLLFPVAARLRRVGTGTLIPILAWLAVASGWYGAYIIIIQGVP